MPPCSTVCWLCIRPLKFYLLQYFMQYVLRVFCYSWIFRFYVYLAVFFRVDLEACQRKCSVTWMNLGSVLCQTEANDTLTGPRRETQTLHRHLIIAVCLYVVLDASPEEYTECWSGLTALKILFCTGCCSIVVSANLWCKHTKLLFFVLFCFF